MRVRRLITNGYWQAGSVLLLLHLATRNLVAQERNPRLTVLGDASFLKAQRIFLVDRDAFRTTLSDGGKLGVRGTMDSFLFIETR